MAVALGERMNTETTLPNSIDAVLDLFRGSGSNEPAKQMDTPHLVIVPFFKRDDINHAKIYTSEFARKKGIVPQGTAYALDNRPLFSVMLDYLAALGLRQSDVGVETRMLDNKPAFVELTFPSARHGYIKGKAAMFVDRYCGMPISEPNSA